MNQVTAPQLRGVPSERYARLLRDVPASDLNRLLGVIVLTRSSKQDLPFRVGLLRSIIQTWNKTYWTDVASVPILMGISSMSTGSVDSIFLTIQDASRLTLKYSHSEMTRIVQATFDRFTHFVEDFQVHASAVDGHSLVSQINHTSKT